MKYSILIFGAVVALQSFALIECQKTINRLRGENMEMWSKAVESAEDYRDLAVLRQKEAEQCRDDALKHLETVRQHNADLVLYAKRLKNHTCTPWLDVP